MLYLSYGMNTNIEQMACRCPGATSLGRYDLKDHALVFRGVADVVESPGDTTQCVLWEITEECEEALDCLEGYPYLYDKKMVTINFMGEEREAMIYYMVNDSSIYSPNQSYLDMLLAGYYAHGLDFRQIYAAEGFTV